VEVEIRSEIQASLIWFCQQKGYSRITKENSLFSSVIRSKIRSEIRSKISWQNGPKWDWRKYDKLEDLKIQYGTMMMV
jgi:hypothetical protein